MTSCLPSYRHGYIKVGQDLRNVMGQFPSFWGFARNGAGTSTIQLMLAFSFLTWGRHLIGSKLEAAGIRGSAFAWMVSFLTPRRQITTVEGCTSAPAEIGASAPQGAILSPLLFSDYVNDLSSATPARNINLFADDTSAYVSSQGPSLLNSDLQTTADYLLSWFNLWHQSIHPAKTVCMVLHSTRMPPWQLNIKINDNHITQFTRSHLQRTTVLEGSRPRCDQQICKENWTPPSPWQATVSNRCPRSLCIHQTWEWIWQHCLEWPQFLGCCTLRAIQQKRCSADHENKPYSRHTSWDPSGPCRFAEPWLSPPYGPVCANS